MKQLNKKSSSIFLKIISRLGTSDHIKLHAAGFMPLSIEYLHPIETEAGRGKVYSICHFYIQNGDLMRDPEMCFIVVPGTNDNPTLIFPQMYQQDSLGLYEESVHIDNGKVTGYIPRWQQSHCNFAQQWLSNIYDQGFLH